MRIKKRGIAYTLSLLLSISMLAACGGNATGSDPANNGQTDTGTTNSAGENPYQDKYDPPVTISTVWGVDPAVTFRDGESQENNVATRWAKERLGIEIKSLWSVTDTNNAYVTKLRLSMTSGQQMPDIVTVNDQLLVKDLIDSGLFQDAGALFDKYANDAWKEAMALDPNVWNAYTKDGVRMGIPVLSYAYNNDYLLWIRQDWLDALGLEGPKTMEELEHVMDQFRNNNPQGLSPNQVTPLSIGFKDSMKTWMGDPSWIFGAYGTIPNQWNEAEDGSLMYGSIHEGMKEGLVKLKEWRDKGYIPKEAALWDANKTAEPASAGTAGIIPGPYWMSGWPLDGTDENAEGAVWKPHLIPTGPDGTAMRHGTPFGAGVTLIHKDMKHPEAFFTYQNYLFDHLADPQEDSEFKDGIFEGYDFAYDADGNPLYLDDVPGKAVNGVLRYFLVRDGARIPDAQFKALLALAEGKEPTTFREREVVNQYGPETPLAATVVMEQEDISKINLFSGPPTDTMKTRMDYLNKIEAQTFNEIIFGEKPVEAFDEFVANWKSSGGDAITNEVNEWYQSVQ